MGVAPVLMLGTLLCAQMPPDLTTAIEVGELLPPKVRPFKDKGSDFIIGGKNSTELIRKLTEINGLPIAALEKSMRPKALSKVGFLGPDEKLLDVLAADNQYVVDELGLSHQTLARHLHAVAAIGLWQEEHRRVGTEFLYHGRRYTVKVEHSRGIQPSPFKDGTESGSNATLVNVDTGKKLRYGLLVPYMIERYGFYEGRGTPYRLDPRAALEVLDFLKK